MDDHDYRNGVEMEAKRRLFIPNPQDTRCNAFFAAVGKALAVATLFEASCRVLHFRVALRETFSRAFSTTLESTSESPPILQSRSAIEEYLKAQGKKLASHVHLIRRYLDRKSMPADVVSQITQILDDARIARNDIAHKATLNFTAWYVDQEALESDMLFLRDRVAKLALALQLFSMMLPMLNLLSEPPPPLEEYNALPATYQAWVFAEL